VRSLEEFTTRLSFLVKHARQILICFVVLTVIAFVALTLTGIKLDNKLQPYNVFSPKKFHDYRVIMKNFPPQLFFKSLIGREDAEIFQHFDAGSLKELWIKASKDKAIFDLIFSIALSSASIFLFLAVLFKRDIKHKSAKFLRGASLIEPSKLNSMIDNDFRITFGKEKVHFPRHYENMGMFLFGAPGSGKSTLLKHLIPQIETDPALIYDRKPEIYQLFYNPERDLLLDPKDQRTIQWNIFKEIHEGEDIDNIISSLISLSDDPKKAFFEQAGRDIFKAIFTRLWKTDSPSNKTLIDFLNDNGSDRERLYEALRDDPRVEGYLSKDNNTSNSIMTVVSQFSNALVRRHFYFDGNFSVRQFIKNGTGRLFVVNRAATEEAFKAYYTLFFDLAFREFLDRSINRTFRFWFVLDEFPSLMRLETLQKLLAEGRDRGNSTILGAQDFEQIKKTYGNDAYSIFNQTNTKIIFRVNDPNTTEYLSRAFGDQEVVQSVKTLSSDVKGQRSGYNFGEQQKVSRLILPSEIKAMKPLNGYVSIGEHPITQISMDIFRQPERTKLIPRTISEIEMREKQIEGGIADELLD